MKGYIAVSIALALCCDIARGQTGQGGAAAADTGNAAPVAAGGVSITLQDALTRARNFNLQYQTAVFATALAHEDRAQAKAALLPTLNAFDQYIYTEGNGTPSGVFVANDGVHVYNIWGVVHDDYSLSKRADYRRSIAAEAVARAKQEVAARGLVATVVQSYYAMITATRKLANARQTLAEAERFFDITRKQEAGGEVAHADVVKAELQVEQHKRDVQDADVNEEKARVALGVLMFPTVDQAFQLPDQLDTSAPLMPLEEFRAAALSHSPDLRAAQASVAQGNWGVASARAGYFPVFSMDFFYGIDANQIAAEDPEGHQRLGYSGQASLTFPIWNWGATRSKVRQAELERQQAQMELSVARRQLYADIGTSYLEAQTARSQLDSLRRSVELSRESLRLTLLRYQAGEATALEVVDAQSTLAQARAAYDYGLVRYAVALATIQTMAGTL